MGTASAADGVSGSRRSAPRCAGSRAALRRRGRWMAPDRAEIARHRISDEVAQHTQDQGDDGQSQKDPAQPDQAIARQRGPWRIPDG